MLIVCRYNKLHTNEPHAVQVDRLGEGSGQAAETHLSQCAARSGTRPPSLLAQDLSNWETVVGSGLVADANLAALPGQPDGRWVPVDQVIVRRVFHRAEGRHGVVR
jgi:hypothetical protein